MRLAIVSLLTMVLSLVFWPTLVQPAFESTPIPRVLAITLASALPQPAAMEAVFEQLPP